MKSMLSVLLCSAFILIGCDSTSSDNSATDKKPAETNLALRDTIVDTLPYPDDGKFYFSIKNGQFYTVIEGDTVRLLSAMMYTSKMYVRNIRSEDFEIISVETKKSETGIAKYYRGPGDYEYVMIMNFPVDYMEDGKYAYDGLYVSEGPSIDFGLVAGEVAPQRTMILKYLRM